MLHSSNILRIDRAKELVGAESWFHWGFKVDGSGKTNEV